MSSETPLTLYTLLRNSIVFSHICPYLSIASLLKVAATSKVFRILVLQDSAAFRYLDLSTVKGAAVDLAPVDRGGTVWRNQRVDESMTEEDFYSGPLRGIFSFLRKTNVLRTVRTLILDGQSAPSEILSEIILDSSFQVQILSIVRSQNLNERKFQQVLQYAVRPSRAEGTPRLKGVYIFGVRSRPALVTFPGSLQNDVTNSPGAQLGVSLNRRSHEALQASLNAEASPWYRNSGKIIPREGSLSQWAMTIKACQGVIAFDAVLCRGPRHDPPGTHTSDVSIEWAAPEIASIALRGCEVCHTLPEGPMSSEDAPSECLPLLAPVPKHSPSIKVAQRPPMFPHTEVPSGQLLMVRCSACCEGRWCEGCNKFWCENHYYSNEGTCVSSKMENIDVGRVTAQGLNLKVHLGLCVEHCLVKELYPSSDGMWA
ncbi:hypothetical protein MMC10_010424 [Thelotrema lepadinum]|nr:hypothetical protein [Thelotrema lepadinum]